MFGTDEVLVPAIRLVGITGINLDETVSEVEFFHLVFDDHQIVFAEGAPSESSLPETFALQTLDTDARAEFKKLFGPDSVQRTPARLIPKAHRQKSLIQRHQKNLKPMFNG